MMRRVNILCSFALLFASHTSLAVTYPLPPEGSRLVGQSFTVTVPDHNTQPLETFAAQYGQGLSNMLEANPGADYCCCRCRVCHPQFTYTKQRDTVFCQLLRITYDVQKQLFSLTATHCRS